VVVWRLGAPSAPVAPAQPPDATPAAAPAPSPVTSSVEQRLDFATVAPAFRFSAALPSGWEVEYVPELGAVNLFDPAAAGASPREQSQVFLRQFTADRFLTLATVDVLAREEVTLGGHAAVRYEIEKKPTVPPFAAQPAWRNQRHEVVDVRLATTNPSLFYVFARHPSLASDVFVQLLASLQFHNDVASFRSPLERAVERVTKKPFGRRVSPDDSPVQPERFRGYHTGTDFEVFPDEAAIEVAVATICGGPLRLKRQADGYGGVAVQECLVGDQPVTVVYGHLELSSVTAAVGEYLVPGTRLGVLGAGETAQTDGERKHLHLGVRRGTTADIRGYVADEAALVDWLDPVALLPLDRAPAVPAS
jgi:hypothetical protein